MSPDSSDYRTLRDPFVIAATAAAFAIRLFHSDYAALWLDEIISAQWVGASFTELLANVLSDNHLPIYPTMLKAWVVVTGDSTMALRLPSVLTSAAAVPVVAACAAALSGQQAARWAAWFTALSPYLLHHAQEARMYPLIALLAAANFYSVARYVTGESERLGPWFLVSNLFLLGTHYYGAFVVVSGVAAVAVLKTKDWREWGFVCVTSSLAVLAPVAVFVLMARHETGSQYNLGITAVPGAIWTMVGGYALIPSSQDVHEHGVRAALPYIPLATVGGSALLVALVSAARNLGTRSLYLCSIVVSVVFLGPFVAYFAGSNISINPRYLTGGVPVFTVLIAIGCATAIERRWGWIVPVALSAVMVVGAAVHLADPGHGREDIRPISLWLTENVAPEEIILVTSQEMATVVEYHASSYRFRTHPQNNVTVDASNVEEVCSHLPVDASARRVVYVFGRSWVSDPQALLEACIRERYDIRASVVVRGIRLYDLAHAD